MQSVTMYLNLPLVKYIFRAKFCPGLGLFFIFLRGEKNGMYSPGLKLGHCHPPDQFWSVPHFEIK